MKLVKNSFLLGMGMGTRHNTPLDSNAHISSNILVPTLSLHLDTHNAPHYHYTAPHYHYTIKGGWGGEGRAGWCDYARASRRNGNGPRPSEAQPQS